MYNSLISFAGFWLSTEKSSPANGAGSNFCSLLNLTAAAALIFVSTLDGPAAAQSAGTSGEAANSIHVSQAVTQHRNPESDTGSHDERVETEWRVVVVSGPVRSRVSGGDWSPVAEGQVFEGRTRVETGDDGHLLLFNGRDSIAVSPGTGLVLPAAPRDRDVTSVTQDSGTARYDVESRRSSGPWQRDLVNTGRAQASDAPSAERFEVETPYLAAVVKGTTFSVSVAQGQASVSVHEGLVAVRDLRSGDTADIAAGRTAIAGPRIGVSVTDSTPGPAAGVPARGPGGGQGDDDVDDDVDDDGDIDDDGDGDADDGDNRSEDADGNKGDDDDDDDRRDADSASERADGNRDDDDDNGDDADDADSASERADGNRDDDDDNGDDADDANDPGRAGKINGNGRNNGKDDGRGKSDIGCNPIGDCGGDRR